MGTAGIQDILDPLKHKTIRKSNRKSEYDLIILIYTMINVHKIIGKHYIINYKVGTYGQ